MIKYRISKLREVMKDNNIYVYIIPSSDYHQSGNVGEYFKARQFMSGFTGSAGTLVVTQDEAGLWTDGRYFIQAENELENSDIKLFKMGEEKVPTIEEYIIDKIPRGYGLGFDGKLISAKEGKSLSKKLEFKDVYIEYTKDLVDQIWKDRPQLSNKKAFLLGTEYTGASYSEKLARIREAMKERNATTLVLTTLDDVAWAFNIRGGDIRYNPVVLAYAIITLDKVYLFIDENKLNDEIKNELNKENTIIKQYDEVYEFVKSLNEYEVVLIDPSKANYTVYNNIPKNIRKIEETTPIVLFNALKNEVELKNIRNSHIKDGVVVTKFIYWVKNNVSKLDITELSAATKIEELRREQENFIEDSFGTISAYKEHAAMMHYNASKESNYKLEPKHLFLIDSGGHYLDGSTDITRTIALGPISDELKKDFTNVVRGMIRLSMAKFLYGCRGYNLDILARGPLWNKGIDYRCGTGHGLGFALSISGSPNGFRWKVVPERYDSGVLEEGMVTSNEPGIYTEGSHGIRIENEIVVRKAEKNEYGQFMDFEVITFAPIDLDAIDVNLLLEDERKYLNYYHKQVYKKISQYLSEDEQKWLKQYTREV